MEATKIEELRKPHPNQQRIDAESAELLRRTNPSHSQPTPLQKFALRVEEWLLEQRKHETEERVDP